MNKCNSCGGTSFRETIIHQREVCIDVDIYGKYIEGTGRTYESTSFPSLQCKRCGSSNRWEIVDERYKILVPEF